jgi:signal transduction histidine kinase
MLLSTLVWLGLHLLGPVDAAHPEPLLVVWIGLLVLFIVWTAYVLARASVREHRMAELHSEFVNAVSHDFRTPLTSIMQSTELLLEGRLHDEAKRNEHLGRISRESRRLSRLVEDLLDFRRMEADALEFQMRPVDLVAMVRDVVTTYNGPDPPEPTRIRLDVSEEDLVVSGDRDALGRALWNLLDNATKYSPPALTVNVVVRRIKGWVAIRVIDRGLGIPRADRKLIYDRFFRGQEARMVDARGTGLGLTMVKHIVTAHNGRMELESTTGSGASFAMLLPLRE